MAEVRGMSQSHPRLLAFSPKEGDFKRDENTAVMLISQLFFHSLEPIEELSLCQGFELFGNRIRSCSLRLSRLHKDGISKIDSLLFP